MTKDDYKRIRARVELRYQQDIDALDRVWAMFNSAPTPGIQMTTPAGIDAAEDVATPVATSRRKRRSFKGMTKEQRQAAKRAYLKAWREKRKAQKIESERGIPKDEFDNLLVDGPTAGGGNGAR